MAPGDKPHKTSWQYLHELVEAAQERGWEVIRFDARLGITLEEAGVTGGIVLNVSGRTLSSAFIRTLPEARMPNDPEPAS